MTQSGKFLPCKHEDLRLNSRPHTKVLSVTMLTPALGRWTWVPRTELQASLAFSMGSRASEKPCLKNQENDI